MNILYPKDFYNRSPSFSSYNSDFSNKNIIDTSPQKGIFHPNPNTYICKVHCCYKFIGLYIFLFGTIFGITFPLAGILAKLIIMTIVGFIIFFICLLIAILISCLLTAEVKFTFTYPKVEITASSACWSRKQIVDIKDISTIYFEYYQKGSGVYQALHIIFKNGNENSYFNFNSRPPCFTKIEVDFFNEEMKKNLLTDLNNL